MSVLLSELETYFLDLEESGLADVEIFRGEKVKENPNNDYYIDWELKAQPKRLDACPVEIFVVESDYFGFGICTFANLAQQVGLRQPSNRGLLVAGHEPLKLSSLELIERCKLIVDVGVSVQYRQLFGSITSARAFIGGVSLAPIRPVGLGFRRYYEYKPWHAN